MKTKKGTAVFSLLAVTGLILISSESWTQTTKQVSSDAVQEAQTPGKVSITRPEQKKNEHDLKDIFAATKAESSSAAFKEQPDEGKMEGFDFYRDPLNSKKPMMTFDEIYKTDVAEKPKIMEKQKELLEKRYNLKPNLSSDVKMTRGKPIAVGPTARLADGATWDSLAAMNAEDIRAKKAFPYPPLPHPKQVTGGQVFPKMQIDMFPRLQRFDVDFDLPDAFLPEFPPAIFLQNRPELGDVSRGEVVSINNYYRLFKDLLTPVQLDGLRMLVTPFPQEEFNPTDDRKSEEASLGIACLDCHVNGHTTAQFHLNPDIRPQERRFRLDTTSLRGMFNQQIHSSKRSLRSVEDFTEFEQRTAYFNGDEIHAAKKGMNILSRVQVSHMAQMQNMFDVPPAPKLDVSGRLDPAKASQAELAGEKIFFEKGKCGNCHVPPFYMDQQMHDLKMERFTQEPGDGPMKTFTLRGIKESPPYMHDGRCLTLEDTVEFFNLVLGLKLTGEEKKNLVAFMRVL
ncbi:cytochrome c catalase, 2 heme-binding sites [Geotalea daltonii FRC-32]|uniref:Cytochrome c catalase, 2 heme-binding sites n=1 Tax=Geotalea daltonii (strain DSM 22248 / JCM 15807 / FRC-32) TaxID=316067 RepID=B9M9L7_GEODF|nr:cytochrome b6 [Geotalea daltonii]ACM20589.1 cytochrome c catalase, 2 heme-binding sites [Geotalea daltonii FRC-32]